MPWPALLHRPQLSARVSVAATAPSHGSPESRLANWVNPAAYTPDPLATLSDGAMSDATVYGNTPRNCIIGPPQKNVDFTLDKTFKLGERQNLRFRDGFLQPVQSSVIRDSGSWRRCRQRVGSAPITLNRRHAAADSVLVEVFVLGEWASDCATGAQSFI